MPNGCHHHHCHQSSSSPPSVIAIAIVVTVAIAIGHDRRCCTRQARGQAGRQAGVQSAGQEGKNAGPRAIWHASKQAGRPRSVDICSLDPPRGAHRNCSQRAHVMWLCCRRRSVSPMPQRPASVPRPLFANATACSSCACACASCATAQAIGNASAAPCASSEQRKARARLCDDDVDTADLPMLPELLHLAEQAGNFGECASVTGQAKLEEDEVETFNNAPDFVVEPLAQPKSQRALCLCPCGCRRQPNRRLACRLGTRGCRAMIGPGCCAHPRAEPNPQEQANELCDDDVDTSWYLCDDDASDVCESLHDGSVLRALHDGSVLRALHDRHRHHRRCQAPRKSVVYVARTGRRFHNSYGCSGALLPLDVLTAHDQGYTPCKKWCCRCLGPA